MLTPNIPELLRAQLARTQLALDVASYQPDTSPLTPARAESFRRVPETCPALHVGGVWAVTSFLEWLDTDFTERAILSEAARIEIAGCVTRLITDLLKTAKEAGTLPLRAALVSEIERHISTPANL